MKKKKLTGKLSLEKSRISALDSAKITGGLNPGTVMGQPHNASECNPCGGGSNITCDIGCQHLTNTEGSACKCK